MNSFDNGWVVYAGESDAGNDVIHIVPAGDLRDHELSNMCWCAPLLDFVDMIATHNSLDRREDYEERIKQRH